MSKSRAVRHRARPVAGRRRRATTTVALIVVAIAGIWFGAARSDAKRLPGQAATGAGSGQTSSSGGAPVAAAGFNPGACVSFAPTSGDRHQTVFLDAGHGGIDPGATGTTGSGATIHEADLTLPVVLDTLPLLRAQGFRVVVSRPGATSVARLVADDISRGR